MNKISITPALIAQVVKIPLIIMAGFLMMSATRSLNQSQAGMALALWATGIAVHIAGTVLSAILHYQCWKALPAGYRSTSPGKAVGFLFIPLFNFYWAFKSYPGLATGFAKYAEANNIQQIKNQKGLAIGYAVAAVIMLILYLRPLLGIPAFIAQGILFFLYYKEMAKYANFALQQQAVIETKI